MYEFKNEKAAETYLLDMLEPYFTLLPQCGLKHVETGQRLRIDFIAKPKRDSEFPFPLIGIEVKRGNYHYASQAYNRPLFQALDYTRCTLDDARVKKHAGERLQKVYLWPGLFSKDGDSVWGVNRLIGLGHVGIILHAVRWGEAAKGEPQFWMCDERQWSPGRPRKNAHKTRHTLGSGVARADAAERTDDKVRWEGHTERTAAALQRKKSDGEVYNHLPLGYDGKDGKLVPIDDELLIVADIKDMRQQGMALRSIADNLNERGIVGKRGGVFHASTIKAICDNELHQP